MSSGTNEYTFTYAPDVTFDPEYQKLISSFYACVDDHNATGDEFADHFTDDATFILGASKAVGRAEIIALLENTWQDIASRKHTLGKAFPYGPSSGSVMANGTCRYNTKAGETTSVQWAGQMDIVRDNSKDGKPKVAFYQVYITPDE